MSAPTVADFRADYPEYAAVSDDIVRARLAVARQLHAIRAEATLLCAAHLLALDADDAGSGADQGRGEVRGESVGQLRVDYVAQAERGRDAFFATTRYGRLLLAIETRTPSRAIGARVYG